MIYIYEASNKDGAIKRGELDALNKIEAYRYLEGQDLIPIKIWEKGEVRGLSSLKKSIFDRITVLDRILLVRNLATTIRAGLGIIEGLDILIVDTKKAAVKSFLTEAKHDLESGWQLSQIFEAHKKDFPSVFTGMIKAGEASGKLEKVLNELSQDLLRDYNLKKKIKNALIYPIILIITAIFVVTIFIFFVLPKFSKVFLRSDVIKLPFITRFFLGVSDTIAGHPFIYFGLIIVIIVSFLYSRRTSWGRKLMFEFVFKVPLARDLIKKVVILRFTRALKSLISSGVPIVESVKLSAQSTGNEFYEKMIIESSKGIEKGISFSKALKKYPDYFPYFLTSLMAIGEQTGTLEKILNDFSEFYDQEVDSALKDLITILEPLLLLFIGLVVGIVAASVLMPIYQLIGSVG